MTGISARATRRASDQGRLLTQLDHLPDVPVEEALEEVVPVGDPAHFFPENASPFTCKTRRRSLSIPARGPRAPEVLFTSLSQFPQPAAERPGAQSREQPEDHDQASQLGFGPLQAARRRREGG